MSNIITGRLFFYVMLAFCFYAYILVTALVPCGGLIANLTFALFYDILHYKDIL